MKYNRTILESKGINDTIQYFAIMFKKLYDSLDDNENSISYSLDGDHFNMENFTVLFKKSTKDHGVFIPKENDDVKNNTLYNCNFIIEFSDINNIVEISAHELTHAYEFIKLHEKIENFDWDQIAETRKPLSFKISASIDTLLKEFDKKNTTLEQFILLVKNTFNKEYNARIAQLHLYLLKFEPDEEILKKEVLNSKTYIMYTRIQEYIDYNFHNKLIQELGKDALLNLTNFFNSELIKNGVDKINGYEFIKIISIDQLEYYYNKWNNLFKHKNDKHYKKIINVISEVIKEKNDEPRRVLENKWSSSNCIDFNYMMDYANFVKIKKTYFFESVEFEQYRKNKSRLQKLKRII